MPRSSHWSPSFWISHQNPHLPQFLHSNYIWRTVQVRKLISLIVSQAVLIFTSCFKFSKAASMCGNHHSQSSASQSQARNQPMLSNDCLLWWFPHMSEILTWYYIYLTPRLVSWDLIFQFKILAFLPLLKDFKYMEPFLHAVTCHHGVTDFLLSEVKFKLCWNVFNIFNFISNFCIIITTDNFVTDLCLVTFPVFPEISSPSSDQNRTSISNHYTTCVSL
jgi:hypothetical protein